MLCSSLLVLNLAFAIGSAQNSKGWNLKNFKTLVTFGDSYTDENRLSYFIRHNGSAPPVGWEQGVVCIAPRVFPFIISCSLKAFPTEII
jgi:phospholipase/lecithinase/hemolysin